MGISFIGIEGNRDGYSPDQCAETCTVRELIDALEYFDDDRPVYLINDNGYTYGSISARDIDEHYVNNQGELDEEDYEEDDEDFEEHYTRKHTMKEEFSGYDVRSLLDQIEAKWGSNTMDRMLDWLVEYSDNGNDQLDEYGYYVPEELEFWISNGKIEDVMTRCLETGRIEESLSSQRRHMHESHRIRKSRLCIKRTHKHPKLMK